ncbi:hypothetical protein FHT02_002128 [Sphingomonas xinjiangensis]|uniref:Uncharacterized protein n=1 Tax=Sphingomonas xinjiangensis TaxID=643568 RepID=A0A840YIZ3_9SPHN|nr:hypothetical protein [Sphingomonas xinjiangensis]
MHTDSYGPLCIFTNESYDCLRNRFVVEQIEFEFMAGNGPQSPQCVGACHENTWGA